MVFSCVALMFFFFKQKTAYEMRISDWSSDVCSSDLHVETATRGIEKTAHRHQSVLCSGRNEIDWGLAAKDARVVGSAKPCNAIEIGRASCRERVCQYV